MSYLTAKESMNLWKYLFIGLLALIILPLLFFMFSSSGGEINTDPVSYDDDIEAAVQVTSEEAEAIANLFLEEKMNDSEIYYGIRIDNDLTLIGQSSYLGIPFDFSADMTPTVLDNGNVRLSIDEIALSGYELPRRLVLNIISSQIELPPFINFNPDSGVININLNEFELENGGHIQVEQFNLQQDVIQARIFLPPNALKMQ